jgi:hypothetical protein
MAQSRATLSGPLHCSAPRPASVTRSRHLPPLLLIYGSKTFVSDTFYAGYRAGQRQTGSGRCGHGPSHRGIVVTGADDQRLHALGRQTMIFVRNRSNVSWSPLPEHLIQRSRPMTILRKEIGKADRCHARTKGSVVQAVGMRAAFVCPHIGLVAADTDCRGSRDAGLSAAEQMHSDICEPVCSIRLFGVNNETSAAGVTGKLVSLP